MRKSVLLIIAFHLSIAISGQTVKEVFTKINSQFVSVKPFSFDMKYSLYKDYKTKVAYQSYNGVFQKNERNEIYMKIDNTEFINISKYSIKVNYIEKAIDVSNKLAESTGDFDVSKLLNLCSINSFKDYKSYWEIVLVPKEFSGLNYARIVLNINKNYLLKKQIFYYNSTVNFSKDYTKQDLSNPRLEVEYNNHNNNSVVSSRFNSNLFFVVNKANKLVLSAKYKDYEINDERTSSQKK